MQLNRCFNYDKFRRVFKGFNEAIVGEPTSLVIGVGTGASNILDLNMVRSQISARGVWLVFRPNSIVKNVDDASINRICFKPCIIDKNIDNVSFRVIADVQVPPSGGSMDRALSTYSNEHILRIFNVVRRGIAETIIGLFKIFGVIDIITPGASNTGSMDMRYSSIIDPLLLKAEVVGSLTYLIKLIQISHPGTTDRIEIKKRVDKIRDAILERRGTSIIYKLDYSQKELSNRDMLKVIEIFEAISRGNVAGSTDLIDIIRDGAIYELALPPIEIGSPRYNSIFNHLKSMDPERLYIIAIGDNYINRIEDDLINNGIEIRNKMILKILKSDFPPTILVIKSLSIDEAKEAIESIRNVSQIKFNSSQ